MIQDPYNLLSLCISRAVSSWGQTSLLYTETHTHTPQSRTQQKQGALYRFRLQNVPAVRYEVTMDCTDLALCLHRCEVGKCPFQHRLATIPKGRNLALQIDVVLLALLCISVCLSFKCENTRGDAPDSAGRRLRTL